MKKLLTFLVITALILLLAACGGAGDPWADATYTEDATLGTGSKTVTVEVAVGEHLVTFTLKTDADYLGEALLASGICQGEDGLYGLYIKTVNGILADYDVNGHYWAFYVNGAYAPKGADQTEINPSDTYRLVYE